jgi:DNA-binding NarL/FixJ family response regulator
VSDAVTPLRVVVADDQASVREGLVLLLSLLPDIDVVASAKNGQEALDRVAEHQPDAILLDLHMPVLDGIEAARLLTEQHPHVAIVVLTTYADDTSVLAALRAGARSYLTKDADRADIAQALRGAATGLSVLDPAVQAALLAATTAPEKPETADAEEERIAALPEDLPDGLTRREGEILTMVARGMTNPDIAAQLYISSHTIKSHINRIFAKTGSPDRAAAVRYARAHHLA